MGWRAHGRAALWIRARRPLTLVKRALSSSPPPDADDLAQPAVSTDPTLEPTLRLAMAAGLLDQARATGGYRTKLSFSYLLWRYAQCPAASYAAYTEDPAEALLVSRLRQRSGLCELALSDLIFRPSRRGLEAATETIRRTVRQNPSDYVLASVRHSGWEAAALGACGFVPLPGIGPVVTVRDLSIPAPGSALLPQGLQASIGDLELF
jgi:hypothetical protein